MDNGFIPVKRSLFSHFLFLEDRIFSRFEAWVDLIQLASFVDEKKELIGGRIVEKNRGEVVASVRYLSDRWQWSRTKVSDFLELLKKDEMISVILESGITKIVLRNFDRHNMAAKERQKKDTETRDSIDFDENFDEEKRQEKATEKPPKSHLKATQVTNTNKGNKGNKDNKGKENTSSPPDGDDDVDAADAAPAKQDYEKVPRDMKSIADFIQARKPTFIEPYKDLWNLFAPTHGFSTVEVINEDRKRKFRVRVREKHFNFPQVLRKAHTAGPILKEGKWFSFDWILANDTNYQKVIEGNYEKNKVAQAAEQKPVHTGPTAREIEEAENRIKLGIT